MEESLGLEGLNISDHELRKLVSLGPALGLRIVRSRLLLQVQRCFIYHLFPKILNPGFRTDRRAVYYKFWLDLRMISKRLRRCTLFLASNPSFRATGQRVSIREMISHDHSSHHSQRRTASGGLQSKSLMAGSGLPSLHLITGTDTRHPSSQLARTPPTPCFHPLSR
jgi:hypothetical protein